MPRASILPTAKSIQPAPQAHSLLDLLSSETYYDVFQAIVQNLPTSAIIALTRVCRHLSGLYRYLLPRDWNIDRHLSRFFQDPLGLRSQMAKSNALISGMMAFRFFEGFLGHPYLEVFVRRGRDAERFTKYLQDIEGYKDPARMSETDTLSLDIAYVLTYYAKGPHAPGAVDPLLVMVAVTEHYPICAILCNASTTLTVNIISWNKAYSIFPLPTFIQRKGFLLRPMDNQCEGIDWDYLRPWWRIQDALWEEEEEAGNHPVWEQRRIGDRFTWTIEFSIRGITCKPKVPDFVLEHCHFRLSKKTDDGSGEGNTGLSWYDLRCAPLKAPVLKFQYTHGGPHYGSLVPIPSDRHEDFVGSWRTLVLQRTDRLTLLELQKMDPSDRPVNYNVIYGEYAALVKKPNRKLDFRVSKIKKPKGWRHVDEDIPRWYHAWEKKTDQSTQKSVTYLS